MNLFSSSPQDLYNSSTHNPFEAFHADWRPRFEEKIDPKQRRRRSQTRVALFLICTFALVAYWWLS